MPLLQDVIHKFEEGPWIRYLRIGLSVLAVVALLVGYNWRSFRNFGSQEAMDSAQVARQLAEGKGYTTLFVRPLSLHLVKSHNQSRLAAGAAVDATDLVQIKERHPDLANPPLYPSVIAAVMKVVKMRWDIDNTKAFWSREGRFWRYQPDFLIALFNELIFFVVIALTFLLAKRLFDPAVAWLSGILLLGSELMWRFSVSGLSTMLLLLIFMGLVWSLVLVESEAREPKWGTRGVFIFAAGAGLMVGMGLLTRYAFGWLIVPVVFFLALFGGQRRAALCVLATVVFGLAVSPWIYRNLRVSGMPFGTATFALLESSAMFPGSNLEQALTPDFTRLFYTGLVPKLITNARHILQSDLPRLGGTWLAPLFLTGLLLGFRNPAIRRLRYFGMTTLAMLVLIQALGRTQLSEDSPELNSENLLVLLVPLVFVYGVSLFYLLLDQMKFKFPRQRFVVVGLFALLMTLPMILTFLPPRSSPLAFPPYHPGAIQQTSSMMKENELMMSDVPWAVAWYGRRQCLWLTSDAHDEFFAVNDLLKPIHGILLTPVTMDARFATQWIEPGPRSWGRFVLDTILVRQSFPTDFPLRFAAPGYLPTHLFLTDSKRWDLKSSTNPPVFAPEVPEKPAKKEN